MLYKPTSASPHTDIVDSNDKNGILFQCETMSNSDITKARLMICDNSYEYYFDIPRSELQTEGNNYGKTFSWTYTTIKKPSLVISCKDGEPIKNKSLVINRGRTYTWQMRLYENTAIGQWNSWIGYGSVDEVSSIKNDGIVDTTILRIYPHTNMYFYDCTQGVNNGNSGRLYNLYSRHDDNARYCMRIKGNSLEIPNYTFYKPNGEFDYSRDLDKYDDPIHGYIKLSGDYSDYEDENYTIFCNYIDSDTYYFDTCSAPIVAFYENFQKVGGGTYKRLIDNTLINSDKTFDLSYSNLNILCDFQQSEGYSVNYYKFILEENTLYGYREIDSTGDIFSPLVEYCYNQFMRNKQYRLSLALTDTAGASYHYSININVKYNSLDSPIQLNIQKYPQDNSVLLDFSKFISISGKEKIEGGHEFVAYNTSTCLKTDNADVPHNACHLDIGNTITYDAIDGAGSLDFDDDCTYYLICNIDDNYTGTIFNSYDHRKGTSDVSLLWTGTQFFINFGTSIFVFSPYTEFYNNKTKDEQIQAIQEAMSVSKHNYEVPFLYYGKLKYNSNDYYHTETAVSKHPWAIIISRKSGEILFRNLADGDNAEWYSATRMMYHGSQIVDPPNSNETKHKSVTLHGGVTYHLFGIDNGRQADVLKPLIEQTKLGDYGWKDDTKLLCNFNNNIYGSNFDGDFGNIDRFIIYKTIGKSSKLHKVYETVNTSERIIEDFTIGDLCDYTYHIYPVCTNTMNINGNQVVIETVNPIVSEPIQIHNDIVSVFGLIPNGYNTYSIDENNVWQLQLNITNDGYTLNTDKTFYQTQHTYGKASGGNRKQRSIPVSGLLGKIDCSTGQYSDSFDHIIEWENFVSSNNLKMLIDLRGIITLGEIDVNPSFSYEKTSNHEVSVSFTFTQLNSIDNVDVLGRALPINPFDNRLLKDGDELMLQDTVKENYHEYLAIPPEEQTA